MNWAATIGYVKRRAKNSLYYLSVVVNLLSIPLVVWETKRIKYDSLLWVCVRKVVAVTMIRSHEVTYSELSRRTVRRFMKAI